MEERDEIGYTERFPGEIVEEYRQPEVGEIVETYTRPLPWLTTGTGMQKTVFKKNRKRGLWIFLGCFAAVLLLAVSAKWIPWPREFPRGGFEKYYRETEPDLLSGDSITMPTWPVGQGVELEVTRTHGKALTAQKIYQQVNPSVVTVMVEVQNGMSVGTGVIFREDGYVVTNYHVVEGGKECLVVLDTGYSYEASYVAGDVTNDLAILKLDLDVEEVPAAEFGDSDLLLVGDPVYAIGNPLGVELRGTLTDGIVSAINRDVEVDGRVLTLIQTNAALNTGNSGGPLINQYGQVVGINVIKMSSSYSNVEGLGFAIPSASMDRMVNDLLTWGELKPEPVLGIAVLQQATELKSGVFGLEVVEVSPYSAAAQAGIQVGDFVISADGEEVRTIQDLLRIRRHHYVGDTLPMVLWRDGEKMEVTLRLREAVEEQTAAESEFWDEAE